MVSKIKCTNPGCVDGKVTLFTSIRDCEVCGGTGFKYIPFGTDESKNEIEDKQEEWNKYCNAKGWVD